MLVKENSMRLQDVARSRLHEDKLHQGCLANPVTPSSIMRCHSLAQTHTRSPRLSSASLSLLQHTPPLHAQYYWGLTLTYPQLLWLRHFEVEIKVFSSMPSIHGPYVIAQRFGEINSRENKICTHVNAVWSWTADLCKCTPQTRGTKSLFLLTYMAWMFDGDRSGNTLHHQMSPQCIQNAPTNISKLNILLISY